MIGPYKFLPPSQFYHISIWGTIFASFPNCRTNKCIFLVLTFISKSFLKWCLFIKKENILWYTAYCLQKNSGRYIQIHVPMLKGYSKLHLTIAICSKNCVQIWKGRDRKTVFCRVKHKRCRANGETFLC